jgi:uncharacterized membrane protein
MYQLSVFLHVTSAVVWVGGMFFLALVAVPAVRKMPPEARSRVVGAMGERFRTIGWICIAVLVVTGIVNLAYRRITWESVATGAIFGTDFGAVLAYKTGVVLAMIALSIVHDFYWGPASTRMMETHGPRDPRVGAARKRASMLGRANAVLALVVVALGVLLVRGW